MVADGKAVSDIMLVRSIVLLPVIVQAKPMLSLEYRKEQVWLMVFLSLDVMFMVVAKVALYLVRLTPPLTMAMSATSGRMAIRRILLTRHGKIKMAISFLTLTWKRVVISSVVVMSITVVLILPMSRSVAALFVAASMEVVRLLPSAVAMSMGKMSLSQAP